jgi:putative methionine-R-sulfoxide reductase with GAF domain
MAETILIEGTTRSEKYESLLKQLKILIGEEKDLISILSNTTAALKETFDFFWIGYANLRNPQCSVCLTFPPNELTSASNFCTASFV